ncbi:BspA family leucine-rich repeat surface protein [Maribacter sp. SA7]|uniref:BspA family leucine-rich repeat surface protein n=1 Tax=Maribacter zhoushanensis TaxID=3030012 RepID=UPI0023EBEFE9|nr:BspA family leucine-rich repeat surface protein [Maribacter zhoushanensis]MDF4203695.1 BspA family leucine-rich repeat surface protein [Maribacter zhoushanensis]
MPTFKKSITLFLLFLSVNLFSQSFNSVWNTNNTESGSSTSTQITIPTNPSYTTYNYDVDWGDGATDTGVTGNITHDYATPGTYTVQISGTFPSIYFNDEEVNDKLKIIEILAWGDIEWQTMENAFYGCENLNFDLIDVPDLAQVTSLKQMFRGCTSFNGIVNDWDTSTINDISGLFHEAETFNRPLANWNTREVTDMSYTFYEAELFNEPLDSWNTAAVTTMSNMFYHAEDFNQNINNWNVSNVTDMSNLFYYAREFNQPLNLWDVSNVTTMASMFYLTPFNQPINNWNISNVTDISGMFQNSSFNQPLNLWDVSNVTTLASTFAQNNSFNQPLNDWDVSNVTNMNRTFGSAGSLKDFNQPLDQWDVSNVTTMSGMFESSSFNQPLNGWDVSNVTNMSNMFAGWASTYVTAYNQPLDLWDVSSVTNMSNMFHDSRFNQNIEGWDVSNVTNMSSMFDNATQFNQPLNNWSITSLTNLDNTFANTPLFNQSLDNWNTAAVTSMRSTFANASAFDQDLSPWDITSVRYMSSMLSNAGLSEENYDATLIGWSTQEVEDDVELGATGLKYCDGRLARQELIDTHNWNITGDIVNCSNVFCTTITNPAEGDTNVPANSNIHWAAAPNATGYYIDLEVERGGVRSFVNINGSPANNYDVGNVQILTFTNEFTPGDTIFITVTPYNGEGPAVGCEEFSFTVVPSWVNSPAAYKFTIDTRLGSAYGTDQFDFRIQRNSSYSYNYSVDWGDSEYNNNVTGNLTHIYNTPGIYTIAIIGDFPAPYNYYGDADEVISIDQWGTHEYQSMQRACFGCENMEYNATDIPDLTHVTDMSEMFENAKLFNGNLNSWDVSNVTNMDSTFKGTHVFNEPLNTWDVSNVTDMTSMFYSAREFDQPLNSWNTGNVTNMGSMFYDAKVFNQPIDWDVSKVTSMYRMFGSTELFNQNINDWDTSSVTNMSSMFRSAESFDRPLNDWNVSSVTTMNYMFSNAEVFNQPLNNWNVNSVTNMGSMFYNAQKFNQNIDSWSVTNVTDMSSMFNSALSFNQPLNSWDVNSVVNMSEMFNGAEVFDQPLIDWDVSAVANMSSMFKNALLFDQPLNNWNVSSVTLMPSMFESAETFNQPLNNWNTAVVTNFAAMFKNALAFNEPLTNWNTGEALTMQEMFSGATAFNQNIDAWNVSFVTTMEAMFNEATSYNQSMNSWNVASVTTMEDMFKGAIAFNEAIGDWNVRGVTTMEEMFSDATVFNQNINNWRITGVSNLDYMFKNASAYNQVMDSWNPGNVSMRAMFDNATSLDQSLAEWDVSGVTNMSDMLDHTALVRENYDATLIAWSEQTLNSGITLGAEGLPYCDAQEERQSMIDNFGWTFSQDVRDCPIPECTQLASPLNGATDVPINTNLTWDAAQFAQGYYLTVGTTAGGNDIVNNETIINETSYEFASDFNTGDTVYVTIVPFNDEGNSGVCNEESFTLSNTLPTIPECTSLVTPVNNDSDVPVTTDLTWNAISNADGYRLTIGTSAGANDILDNFDVENVTTHDLVTDLPEDSDIFITIIPYNEQGPADSCTEEFFHTETIPVAPTCTNLISPAHQETDVAIDTNLSWTEVPEATGYLVIVGLTEGGNEIVNNVDVSNVTTYDIPDDLLESRTYYVTIIPYNDVDDAAGCIEESFTTGDSTSPPSCPILNSPANGATQVPLDTNLSWNGSGSADGYRLTVGTTSGGSDIFTGDLGNETTYDFVSDLPENETIHVSIIAYNINGPSSGCTEYTFETAGPPECTTLISPTNNDTNVAIDTSIAWNAVTDANGYRITVIGSNSTANNMTDFEITSDTTFDFPNDFIQGETVTVTIKPYNDNGEAIGCTSESFTIIPPPLPSCTSLISPLNNAVNVDNDTDLSWNAVTDATGYKLTVIASESTDNNLNEVDVIANSYDFTNDFIQGETVTVTIKPFNNSGEAIDCTSESFTIKPVPSCTSLSMPLNGATAVDIGTSISWNAVTDALGYFVTVNASNSTANNFIDRKTTTTAIDFDSDFTQGETVSVTITPYNESGNAIGCNTETFTIEAIPQCTTLISPANGDVDVAINTNLEWAPVPEAVGYVLSVNADNSIANNVLELDITAGNTHDFTNDFEQGETVAVTIVPYNAAGEAIGCSTESFTIKSVPNCTTLISPINGDVVPELNEITWNAVTDANGYRLTITSSNSIENNITNLEILDTTYTFPYEFNIGETVTITIVPFNEIGDAIGCTSENITIRPIPVCTTLIPSLQNGNDISVSTDIEWNAANEADGYYISIGTTEDGTDIVNNEDVASLTSYTLSQDLPSETLIYVYITPYNSSGIAEGCISENFTTEIIAPDCAVLMSPANGETDVSLESTISWDEVEHTDGYYISIGTSAEENDILDTIDMGNTTSYTHGEELPFDSEIYITITPYNSVGEAIGCELQSFTTMIPEDETKYGFSPDGDGINEYWHIENIDYYPENVVSIYNRWGAMVFQIENYDNVSNVFSGTANVQTKLGADQLPTGTYFFNIQIEGETILRKTQGYLVLKR